MAPTELCGDPVATRVREAVDERVRALDEEGVTPALGTVMATDAPGAAKYMDLKHEACADHGIATRDHRLAPDASRSVVFEAVEALSEDEAVDAVFVQTPLPDGVDAAAVGRRLDPAKDVDCVHPANLGRLVDGDPRFIPATTAAVVRLLDHYGVRTVGRHAVVVGRSRAIGRPLANRLLWRSDPGNATVTVGHSRAADLGAVTRRADVLVTAAGKPGLVDGSMLSSGVAVVDVSANRRPDGSVVGDVDAGSARRKADAFTPVPGGVGPVTLAALLDNVVTAAERRAASAPDRPPT